MTAEELVQSRMYYDRLREQTYRVRLRELMMHGKSQGGKGKSKSKRAAAKRKLRAVKAARQAQGRTDPPAAPAPEQKKSQLVLSEWLCASLTRYAR